MRILIVKTSSMGDVVHALPAVSDMAQALPGVQIDWLVEKSFAAMPSRHRHVERVIALQWRAWRKSLHKAQTREAMGLMRAQLQEHRYDLIIDLQGLLKSAVFACLAHGPRAGYDAASAREPLASLFYQRKATVSRQLHAVDRCRQLAAQVLGYTCPQTPPDFGLQAQADAWRPAGGRHFAALIPCASRPEKLWPVDRWVALALALQAKGLGISVFWGSEPERLRAQCIAAQCGGHVPPFLTVARAADSLAQADVVVGLDTGMTHLAAAHARPTVGIYCDHEPGLTGVVGCAPTASLGGKGCSPSLEAVLESTWHVLQLPTSPSSPHTFDSPVP